MRTLTKALLAAAVFAGMSINSHALQITPATENIATGGNQTSVPDIFDAIFDDIGLDLSDSELYKQDEPGDPDTGSFASSYQTTYSNIPSDPEDALIEYVGGPAITGQTYLLVKDGKETPSWYLYDLTDLGWNGTEDLDLQDFWPNQGAISHVSIYGEGGSVPDAGGTLALLGLAIGSLSLLRRKQRA